MPSHYAQLYERMSQNKDSIFEPCLITEYNGKHVTANVYCLTSQQYRERVPVLFPSFYLNRGHICPPAPQSTGLLFWGADRQAFVMPAQFIPPTYVSDNGDPVRSGSPALIDPTLTIEHIEAGEQHLSSLRGAYLHLKNVGDVELGTSSFYRFSLSDTRQSAELTSPSFFQRHKGYESHFGSTLDHKPFKHERMFVPRTLESVSRSTLIQSAIDGTFSDYVTDAGNTYWNSQIGVVENNGQTLSSSLDNSPLFRREELIYNNYTAFRSDLSRMGNAEVELKNERYETRVVVRPGSLQFRFIDHQATNPSDREIIHTFGF